MTRVTVTEATPARFVAPRYPCIMQGVPNPENVVLFTSKSRGIRLRGPLSTQPLSAEQGFQNADDTAWWKPFVGTITLDTTQ
jgi:hypothetical protein